MNVFEEREKIRLPIAQNGFVAALKKMTDGAVFPVEVHGIALVDALENPGQRDVLCFDQQVEVVAHEDISIDVEMLSLFVRRHDLEILLIVPRIFEDLLLLVATGYDMIEGASILDAWFAGHETMIANL